MRIFGLAADAQGCGQYRIGMPLTQAKILGHEVAAGTAISRQTAHQFDVIIGQRVCLPEASVLFQDLAAEGLGMVFEIDDDLLHVDPDNHVSFGFFHDATTQRNLIANAAAAKLVTVSTEPLAKVMREHSDNVVVVPNAIPRNLLSIEREPHEGVRLGWAGSGTHRADLAVIAGHLRRFLAKNPKVEMHIVGADYSPLIRGIKVVHKQWDESVFAYYGNLDFDIGLAPLVNHQFNRCKSAIKALEYAALGIPVIASDVAPYRDFVEHGVTGFLVSQDHEWAKRLRELTLDHDMRAEMGANARALAAEHTVEGNIDRWLAAWESVANPAFRDTEAPPWAIQESTG
jgi:glycosyltransferase involved in cell wall biosynthesis